jgi:hypothetical protein
MEEATLGVTLQGRLLPGELPNAGLSSATLLGGSFGAGAARQSNHRLERSVMHKVPIARYQAHLLSLCQPRAIGGRAAAQPDR